MCFSCIIINLSLVFRGVFSQQFCMIQLRQVVWEAGYRNDCERYSSAFQNLDLLKEGAWGTLVWATEVPRRSPLLGPRGSCYSQSEQEGL